MTGVWPSERSASKEYYDRAVSVMPGGITRIQPWQDPFPVYAERGEGAYVVDVDGTRRLDMMNNFATLIHGHAHPVIVAAAQAAMQRGTSFALPTPAEVALAEAICARTDNFEWVRFSNSGSEAIMCAIKAARALTGRPRIVKIEGSYHGMYDYAEVSLDSAPANWGNDPRPVGFSKGVPQGVLDDVIVIPFNDCEAGERIIRAGREHIAAILVDPAPGYLGFTPIDRDFAAMLRRVASDIGALIILDEVISFRMHFGGAQTLYGLEPDFTTLAKIIGGGFPIGAVAGRRAVMKVFDHRQGKPLLPWSGTFTGNPVSTAAGKAALDLLPQVEIDRLELLGTRLRRQIAGMIASSGVPAQITGIASMFQIHGHDRTISDYRTAFHSPEEAARLRRLQAAMLLAGHHMSSRGMGFLSTPMSEIEVDAFCEAFSRCVGALGVT